MSIFIETHKLNIVTQIFIPYFLLNKTLDIQYSKQTKFTVATKQDYFVSTQQQYKHNHNS